MKLFDYNTPAYFAHHLTRQVKELYMSVAMMDLAVAAVTIFEPIYLYTLGYSLQEILLFFIGVYGFYFFVIPLGAKVASRYGYEHSIFYSTFFLVFYYLSLFAIEGNSFFIYVAPIMLALQKALYWPGYHADFARFSDSREQSREISNLIVLDSIVYIIGPLAGGLLITIFGFQVLFVVVIVLILASNIPLLSTREKFKPASFSYKDAYKRLFKKHHRRKLLAYFGFGEELIVMVIWPVFIFVVIKDFFQVGSVVAVSTLVTTLITLYIGRLSDKTNKRSVLKSGTVFYALAWFLRVFVKSVSHIFLVDTLSRISKNIIYVPLVAITYERARKYSVMKQIIIFEMSLILGKLIAMLILYFILFFISPGWDVAFILAALMSLFYVFL